MSGITQMQEEGSVSLSLNHWQRIICFCESLSINQFRNLTTISKSNKRDPVSRMISPGQAVLKVSLGWFAFMERWFSIPECT